MTRYVASVSQGPIRAAKLVLETAEAYGKDPVTEEELAEQREAALEAFYVKLHSMEKNEGFAIIASLHSLVSVAEQLKVRALGHAVTHWGLKHMEDRTGLGDNE